MEALALIFVFAAVFMVLERVFPGRELPQSPGWYFRAVFLNAAQLGIVVLGGYTWSVWLQGPSLFHLDGTSPAVVQGFVCWFVGTFFFYWWHRARHSVGLFWRVFHQIHHSATRIETLTSFYKHPLEIAINSVLSTAIVFPLLGASIEASPWYSFFAALGEFYYHANLRTPRWTGYFIQRPEQHSIHHQLEVHDFNYGDITWWDRLFGTFRDPDTFVPKCGYHGDREQLLGQMLVFQDVNIKATDRDRPRFLHHRITSSLHLAAMGPDAIEPIRKSVEADLPAMLAIVNDAAQAYRGAIPADRWHEPYMPADELDKEIAAGVVFWVAENEGRMSGVMGIQDKGDVALVRHAYVASSMQRKGVGTRLLRHVEGLVDKPILIGTWADASWAIDFYRRNGYTVVSNKHKDRLLRTYWAIPTRQIETSVVLADGRWMEIQERAPVDG